MFRRIGSSDNYYDLYLGSVEFESEAVHNLPIVGDCVVFFSPSMQIPEQLAHFHTPLDYHQAICSYTLNY
jgi:hypothetical protein